MNNFYDDDKVEARTGSSDHLTGTTNFTGSGFILFLNQIVIAAGNWLFWMFISRIATTEEIGQSTTMYSLVIFTTALIQIGLEYPLLKYARKYQNSILFTTLIIELIISFSSIPLVLYFVYAFYEETLQQFAFITLLMILMTAPGFVSHFLLLGLFKVRAVFVIDVIATAIKFGVGYFLVTFGFGALGILLAFVVHIILVSVLGFMLLRSELPFMLDFSIVKLILKEALVNAPSKIARILIFSLSIILLASFGVDISLIGVFYMALTISLVLGGFATNIALMIIPASNKSLKDYSVLGLRIGLSFTIPIIVSLTIAPSSILALIGSNYTIASFDLVILALSIFPSSITITAISNLNTRDQYRKILVLGMLEIVAFVVAFSILAPQMETIGASIATLIAFSSSAALSVFWMRSTFLKYISNSALALVLGMTIGYSLNYIMADMEKTGLFGMLVAVITSIVTVFYLNKIKIVEIMQIVKTMISKR